MAGITNFDSRDMPIYKEAVKRHGGKRVWIRKEGIGGASGPSLHSNLSTLSRFWNIFDAVAVEMGGTMIQKAIRQSNTK